MSLISWLLGIDAELERRDPDKVAIIFDVSSRGSFVEERRSGSEVCKVKRRLPYFLNGFELSGKFGSSSRASLVRLQHGFGAKAVR